MADAIGGFGHYPVAGPMHLAPMGFDPLTKQQVFVDPVTKQAVVPYPITKGVVPAVAPGVGASPGFDAISKAGMPPIVPMPPVFHQPVDVAPQAHGGNLASYLRGEAAPANEDQHVHAVSEHLLQALSSVRDANLRNSLSNAFAALQKHMAQRQQEHEQMLQGRFSPRLMREAYAAQNRATPQLMHQAETYAAHPAPHLPVMPQTMLPHLPIVGPQHAAAYSHAPAANHFAAQ